MPSVPTPPLLQVRLKTLCCVAAALGDPQRGASCPAHAELREEEAAPLLGYLASTLLQVGRRGWLAVIITRPQVQGVVGACASCTSFSVQFF